MFVKTFWNVIVAEPPIWNWHIEHNCNILQEAAELVFAGKPKQYDILLNQPPGTTKSLIASIFFAPWTWTRMPTAKHICSSYSYPLALDLSLKSRKIVQSDLYKELFPKITLSEDQNTKGYWVNTTGGWRFSVGTGGSVTGMHAHFISIDDPINPEQAASELDLATANRFVSDTLSSRKVDKAITLTILTMQRLHQNDPTAVFKEKNRAVRHICLPAESEDLVIPNELKKFYKDGLLDPIRLSKDVLDEYKLKGEFFYASQFRQSPTPPGGGMFKVDRIKRGIPPTKFISQVRYWDKAGTFGGKGAYTVGVKLSQDKENRIWVTDVKRVRLDSAERERLIKRTAEEDGIRCLVGIEQSGGEGGKESAQNTATQTLKGFRVRVWKVGKADGDKEQRADAFSSQVNHGNVYIPANAEWADVYIDELKYFPYSKYKDQVDASAGAFHFLIKKKVVIGALR